MNCPVAAGDRRLPGPPQWLDQKHVRPRGRGSSQVCPEVILSGPAPVVSDRAIAHLKERTGPAVSTIVAHTHPFVIGVDTHARTHTYAVLTAAGEHLGTETFPNTAAGRSRAISWAGRRASGVADALWVIEGVGSYGAQLARNVTDTGYRVVEAARMSGGRRGVGKSDPIDARRIAAAVLALPTDQLRNPRQDEGVRAATQILLTVRDELTGERTRAVNALTALLRITDLGLDVRRPPRCSPNR